MSDLTALNGTLSNNEGLAGLGAAGTLAGGIAGFIQSRRNAEIQEKLGIQAQAREKKLALTLDANQSISVVGLDPNFGSPTDIGVDAAGEGALAGLRARYGFDSIADATRQEGNLALIGGATAAAGTLFGAAIEKFGEKDKGFDQLGASDTRRLRAIAPEADGMDPALFGPAPRRAAKPR